MRIAGLYWPQISDAHISSNVENIPQQYVLFIDKYQCILQLNVEGLRKAINQKILLTNENTNPSTNQFSNAIIKYEMKITGKHSNKKKIQKNSKRYWTANFQVKFRNLADKLQPLNIIQC